MPIVFVHGVAERNADRRHGERWEGVERYLRQFVAPVIAANPAQTPIIHAYWGDIGVRFAWSGASCPSTLSVSVRDHPFVSLLPTRHHGEVWREMGRRSLAFPAHLATRAASGVRAAIHGETAVFLGDALHYFAMRGAAPTPGPIPLRILEALAQAQAHPRRQAGEALVVLSHSLGGTIVYDLVSHFLPALERYQDIYIDFWCAASSQIGLFEEMKLFLASRPEYGAGNPVPFPDRRFLGGWWNMWDPQDFISFTARNIVAGIDDSPYDSGLPVGLAHFGCLTQPSFYTLLGRKLAEAKAHAYRAG